LIIVAAQVSISVITRANECESVLCVFSEERPWLEILDLRVIELSGISTMRAWGLVHGWVPRISSAILSKDTGIAWLRCGVIH
jgi:hypothetical protein